MMRRSLADVRVRSDQLVWPIFVTCDSQRHEVASMPGVYQWPVADAADMVESLVGRGLRHVLLFGVTPNDRKDPTGSFADDKSSPVNQLTAMIKQRSLDVTIWADVCLCEYTSHGHCGVLDGPGPQVNRDVPATLKRLASIAVANADSGADIVAPSAVCDGQVAAIRRGLDQAGFPDVPICGYTVKYASNLYGPFRDAGQGGMAFGNRRGYQMDYHRQNEWAVALQADIEQGADMVMVKPAATYLDIVHQVRQSCDLPVAAYHVSGEYAMLVAAAEAGSIDLEPAVMETTTAIVRAGADLVITYFADRLLDWTANGS